VEEGNGRLRQTKEVQGKSTMLTWQDSEKQRKFERKLQTLVDKDQAAAIEDVP
jgi:hypothetical protein